MGVASRVDNCERNGVVELTSRYSPTKPEVLAPTVAVDEDEELPGSTFDDVAGLDLIGAIHG